MLYTQGCQAKIKYFLACQVYLHSGTNHSVGTEQQLFSTGRVSFCIDLKTACISVPRTDYIMCLLSVESLGSQILAHEWLRSKHIKTWGRVIHAVHSQKNSHTERAREMWPVWDNLLCLDRNHSYPMQLGCDEGDTSTSKLAKWDVHFWVQYKFPIWAYM